MLFVEAVVWARGVGEVGALTTSSVHNVDVFMVGACGKEVGGGMEGFHSPGLRQESELACCELYGLDLIYCPC